MRYESEIRLQKVLWYIIIILSSYLLVSCSKTVYVPVESVRTEYRDVYLRDSIHHYDSIYVKEKGDTIRIEKYKYLYRDRFLKDSVYLNDTIRIPYPVEKLVIQNKLKWYQKILTYLGLITVFSGICLLIVKR